MNNNFDKVVISENLNFTDGRLKSLSRMNGNLQILFISWDDRLIKLNFKSNIQFVIKPGEVLKEVYEVMNKNIFFHEAITLEETKEPELYKLYQIVDIDDFPFVEIVAKSVNFSISSEPIIEELL